MYNSLFNTVVTIQKLELCHQLKKFSSSISLLTINELNLQIMSLLKRMMELSQ
jgi:hypothetical protein